MGDRNEPASPDGLGGISLPGWSRRRNAAGGAAVGSSTSLARNKGIPRDIDFLAEADARLSAVRSGMGEEVWEEAWRKGRAMTLEEAVSYALEVEEEASG